MLYIHHHLGVGDHIICNGLVRSLLEREGQVGLFVKERNYNSIQRMYDDTQNIHLHPLVEGQDDCPSVDRIVNSVGGRLLRVGFDQMLKVPSMNFDMVFYIYAGVPFDHRWSKFHVRRNADEEARVLEKLNPRNEPYMFVHDDPSRGYHVNPPNSVGLKVIKNDPTVSMFSMIGLLEGASEIHCMESSFRCLIESIPSIRCPLYLHRKIRSADVPREHLSIGKKPWIEI